jgi:lysophospholipase L1-like esterase
MIPFSNFTKILFSLIFLANFGLTSQTLYPNLNLGENVIEYSSSGLSNFKSKMDSLKKGLKNKINIIHIGDSHIQANKLTSETREVLQTKYGNGGRGLIFPYSLAKTNGPKDYTAASSNDWLKSTNIDFKHNFPIGLMGVSLRSVADSGSINLKLGYDSLPMAYSKSILFFTSSPTAEINFNGRDKPKPLRENKKPFDTLTFNSSSPQSSLLINFNRSNFCLHGIYLENLNQGLIYNSIGINGARFKDYCQTEYFFEQLKLLKADLVIISLGTNESYSSKYTDEEFILYVNLFLSKIKTAFPKTDVILTCPSENYHIKKKRPIENSKIINVNSILRKVAKEKKLAIWDLYKVMGGKGSMKQWKAEGLVNNDYVHFLRAGYKLQGYLLANALINFIEN